MGDPDAEIVGTRDVDGVVRPFVSWTGLLPLYAGIPSPERARRMVEVLLRPEGFWGPVGVRTCPADDLYFQQSPRVLRFDVSKGRRGPVSNWSGPVWVLSSAYLAEGLARYGYTAEARELALRTARSSPPTSRAPARCTSAGTTPGWASGPGAERSSAGTSSAPGCSTGTPDRSDSRRAKARDSFDGVPGPVVKVRSVQRSKGLTADGRSAPAAPSDHG